MLLIGFPWDCVVWTVGRKSRITVAELSESNRFPPQQVGVVGAVITALYDKRDNASPRLGNGDLQCSADITVSLLGQLLQYGGWSCTFVILARFLHSLSVTTHSAANRQIAIVECAMLKLYGCPLTLMNGREKESAHLVISRGTPEQQNLASRFSRPKKLKIRKVLLEELRGEQRYVAKRRKRLFARHAKRSQKCL
mgnify:CR=1 FL=1